MNKVFKKLLPLCLMALCTGYGALRAQVVVVQGAPEDPMPFSRNEVRLNLLPPVAMKTLSLEYERAVLKDLGVGAFINAYLGAQDSKPPFYPTFSAVPYARWYFGGKRLSMTRTTSGFFLEANSSIGYDRDVYHAEYDSKTGEMKSESRSGVCWGIGLGAGWKYVSRSNWSGEIGLRAGRNIVKVAEHDVAYLYPFISVGYRF